MKLFETKKLPLSASVEQVSLISFAPTSILKKKVGVLNSAVPQE